MFRLPLITALALTLSAPFANLACAQSDEGAPINQPTAEAAPAADNAVAANVAQAELDARLTRLERENRQLREQLAQARDAQPAPLLDGEQRWFLIGAAVAVLSFIFGLLYARGQRRRQWLN